VLQGSYITGACLVVDGGTIVNCNVPAEVVVMLKNPANPGSSVENVILQRYDVSYQRSDGRGVEGVDVPYRFSGAMTASAVRNDDCRNHLVRQQVLEPPLSNITGLQIVEMTANVTFYGETVSRATVSATGAAAVRFADYGSGTPTCEGS
jgi:hypothetical protein